MSRRKNKKLVVIPFAGLGNRMRVLASCVQLAKKDNRALWIAWPVNADLGCDLKDIFENIGMEYAVPSPWIKFLLTQAYRPGAIKSFYSIYKLVSGLFANRSLFDRDVTSKGFEITGSNDATILIATCFAFINHLSFEDFVFAKPIRDQVEREKLKLGTSYHGIHIRRTDHADIIKNSPLESYLNSIDKIINDDPHSVFFLATDDARVKELMRERYSDRIFALDYKLTRADKEGIQIAIIELMLLSKSRKLICSRLSSFSDTAISIGNIEDVIYV